jgi:hypothetical protein
MERSKVEAFFREFPFLKDFINSNAVGEVKVSRVDEKLLKEIPYRDEHFMTFPADAHKDIALLLDADGKSLGSVRQEGTYNLAPRKWYDLRRWAGERVQGESIGDALIRLKDDAKKVVYVLWLEAHGREWNKWKITLHKPPKTFTLLSWIETLVQHEQACIQADVHLIDEEGAKVVSDCHFHALANKER